MQEYYKGNLRYMSFDNKISIIMPIYNSEKYVVEAIESVLRQTYTNWELLSVDDGSTDRSGEIIDLYAARDARIKAFHTENKGVSHARNIGLEMAEGEWITFLDSDDIFPKEALQIFIKHSDDYDIVSGNFVKFPDENYVYQIKLCKSFTINENVLLEYNDMMAIAYCAVWRKLIRKSAITYCRFEEGCQIGEDKLFLAQMISTPHKVKLITDVVYKYRINNIGSLTHTVHDNGNIYWLNKVTEIYLEHFQNKEMRTLICAVYLNVLANRMSLICNDLSLNDDDRKIELQSLLSNKVLKMIPLEKYPFTAKGCRKVALLLIGNVDLIMNEFKNKTEGMINKDRQEI